MKVIHTADWHLGDSLGKIKRHDDFGSRVEIVANLCAEHAVDILLIAGDLFSEQASVEDMTRSLQHIHETFEPFFSRGGTILAITGNHDKDHNINMVRVGMSLASPTPDNGFLERGRMYMENRLQLVSLEGGNGERVQFVLVPYPNASRYLEATDVFRTKEEENRLLQGRVADWIKEVPDKPAFDKSLPTVLTAHLHVRGSEVHTLYRLTEQEDLVFDPGFIPTAWCYVALGHIHKPQALSGMIPVRYSGSLDRCDFGEIDEEKGVVLLDIGPSGLRGDPVWLPIAPTPMYHIDLTSPADDMPRLEQQYSNRATAIVRVLATHDPNGPSREEITRELRRLFPRLYKLEWTAEPDRAGEAPALAIDPRGNPRQVIADYLAAQLKDDLDKDEIVALVEPYLKAEEQR